MTELMRRAQDKCSTLPMAIIPVVLLLLLGFALAALIFVDARQANHDILLMVLTFITAKLGTIVDHHFGSSAASQRKDEIINTQAHTMQTAQKTLSAVTDMPNTTGNTVELTPGDSVKVEGVEQT